MPDVQSTLQSRIIDLASEALTSFCDDMSGMFGVHMSCEQVNVNEDARAEIEESYKTLGAVYSVKVSGTLNDDFQILVDKPGLFTITGVVVMLPKSRILSSAKRGTLADAHEISDAVGEVGNLMIGSWDRVFRAGLDENTHFLHSDTFVGDPCAEDNGVLDLHSDEEVTFVSYEMTVREYPPFKCGVYLPNRLFDEVESDPETDGQDEAEPAVLEAEAAPTEAADPVTASTEEPESPDLPMQSTDADAEAVLVDIDDPVAAPVQESESPEPLIPSDDSQAEAVPSEGEDAVLIGAESVSVNPGGSQLAKDLMQTQVYWVSVDDTVNQAQTKMREVGVSYLLVGDGTKLAGIVTRSDVDSAASVYLRPIFSKWRRPEDDATLQIRLKWIMSKQIYSVKPETPLFNIVHLKCKCDISCLPVVDAQGQVLGVVTTTDVLKSVMNQDLSAMGVAVA